jgi:hypothetical protein
MSMVFPVNESELLFSVNLKVFVVVVAVAFQLNIFEVLSFVPG